jgi:glucan biosynthesis protein C
MKQRLYYLDFARSILIVLVVYVHCTYLFLPDKQWFLLLSDHKPFWLDFIERFLGGFRLQTFFIIAGFFCAFTFTKHLPEKNLKIRAKRLLVPSLFAGLTIQFIHPAAIYLVEQGSLNGFLSNFPYQNYFLQGGWIEHLWFLNNLFVYYTIYYLALKAFKNFTVKPIGLNNLWWLFGLFFGLVFVSQLVIMAIAEKLPVYIFSFIATYKFLLYLPYFVVGLLLFSNKELLNKVVSISIKWAVAILLLYTTFELVYTLVKPEYENFIVRNLFREAEIVFSALMAVVVFVFGHRYFNVRNEKILAISDSAYTIYILHQPLLLAIVLYGYVFFRNANEYGVYGFLSTLVVVITYISHIYIIRKSKILSFLLNGKDF